MTQNSQKVPLISRSRIIIQFDYTKRDTAMQCLFYL